MFKKISFLIAFAISSSFIHAAYTEHKEIHNEYESTYYNDFVSDLLKQSGFMLRKDPVKNRTFGEIYNSLPQNNIDKPIKKLLNRIYRISYKHNFPAPRDLTELNQQEEDLRLDYKSKKTRPEIKSADPLSKEETSSYEPSSIRYNETSLKNDSFNNRLPYRESSKSLTTDHKKTDSSTDRLMEDLIDVQLMQVEKIENMHRDLKTLIQIIEKIDFTKKNVKKILSITKKIERKLEEEKKLDSNKESNQSFGNLRYADNRIADAVDNKYAIRNDRSPYRATSNDRIYSKESERQPKVGKPNPFSGRTTEKENETSNLSVRRGR